MEPSPTSTLRPLAFVLSSVDASPLQKNLTRPHPAPCSSSVCTPNLCNHAQLRTKASHRSLSTPESLHLLAGTRLLWDRKGSGRNVPNAGSGLWGLHGVFQLRAGLLLEYQTQSG